MIIVEIETIDDIAMNIMTIDGLGIAPIDEWRESRKENEFESGRRSQRQRSES